MGRGEFRSGFPRINIIDHCQYFFQGSGGGGGGERERERESENNIGFHKKM